ncbi:MAG: hypothetical protein M1381_09245 [Deltaproteobacteria bacterium]|nr:hypothetical protein [Deltaproteobacteria bacterium]MCL5792020.1 hypothetical protein [Deltaproteobacteria bacterium]
MPPLKEYPKVKWNEPIYWLKILGVFLLIGMTQLITFLYLNIPYIIPVPLVIGVLLLFAIDQKQKLLSISINSIISIMKDILKPLIGSESTDKHSFPIWNLYRKKIRKLTIYLAIITYLPIFFVLLFKYYNSNLPYHIVLYSLLPFYFSSPYIDSFYIKKYLEKTINIDTSILSNAAKNIPPFKVEWLKFKRRMIIDWIITGILIFVDAILYWFHIVTLLANGLFIFLFAILYPTTRLTIDLNIQFNRFSSALEKAAADLFIEKDEEAK